MFPNIATLGDRFDDDEYTWTKKEVTQAEACLIILLQTRDLQNIVMFYITTPYKRHVMECVDKIDPNPFLDLPLISSFGMKERFGMSKTFEKKHKEARSAFLESQKKRCRTSTLEDRKKYAQVKHDLKLLWVELDKKTKEITKQAFSTVIDKFKELFCEYKSRTEFCYVFFRNIEVYIQQIIHKHYNKATTNLSSSTRDLFRDMYVALFETHTALQTIIKMDRMILDNNTDFQLVKTALSEEEKWNYFVMVREDLESEYKEPTQEPHLPREITVRIEHTIDRDMSHFQVEEIDKNDEDDPDLCNEICEVLADGSARCFGNGWSWKISREEIHRLYLRHLPPTRILPIPLEAEFTSLESSEQKQEIDQYHTELKEKLDKKIKELNQSIKDQEEKSKALKKQMDKAMKQTTSLQEQLQATKRLATKCESRHYVVAHRFKRKASVLEEDEFYEMEGEKSGKQRRVS